jgi:hypothetical protein
MLAYHVKCENGDPPILYINGGTCTNDSAYRVFEAETPAGMPVYVGVMPLADFSSHRTICRLPTYPHIWEKSATYPNQRGQLPTSLHPNVTKSHSGDGKPRPRHIWGAHVDAF